MQSNAAKTDRPLVELGIDPSSARGARIQAIRIRRYWLLRNIDVNVDVQVTMHRVETRGAPRAMSQTVYGVKADFRNARRVSPEEASKLLYLLQDESEVYA